MITAGRHLGGGAGFGCKRERWICGGRGNCNSRSPSGMTTRKAKATATATAKYRDPSLRSG
jgi:hypothetical protein